MDNALPWIRRPSLAQCRELAWPKEHGSWSLALEPLAFGLIAAPSVAGGWLAVAVAAAFFARRPLRIALRDARAERRADARAVLAIAVAVALIAAGAAISLAGFAWLPWLAPVAAAGAVFLSFDVRNAGREETAEVAGAAAFAFLPAALAVLGGASAPVAVALALVMCGRAVPTVLCVRAALREAKTGVRRSAPALIAAFAAVMATIGLSTTGLAPWAAAGALGVLVLRAVALLVFPKPTLRARTIGMIEAALGAAFVVLVAAFWNF